MAEKNKRILVTGGAGYIGCVLVPTLLNKGFQVRVLDSLFFGDQGLAAVKNRIELIKGDIRQIDQKVFEGIDAVINLAGFSNDPTAEANPKANFEINTEGAIAVAAAAKKFGVKRFIQASSCSVYYSEADSLDDTLRTETSNIHPTAPYSLSKMKAEQGILALADAGFCPVVIRKGTVFGYSPRMRYDLVVNTFCRDAFHKGVIVLNGGGELWRPLVHIKDVADLYTNLVDIPEDKIRGQIFNLVHKNYRISELGLWFRYILRQRKQVEILPRYEELSARGRSYRVSSEKMQKVLGLAPVLGVTAAVNEMFDKMEAGEFIDFENPAYYNIEWMKLGYIK